MYPKPQVIDEETKTQRGSTPLAPMTQLGVRIRTHVHELLDPCPLQAPNKVSLSLLLATTPQQVVGLPPSFTLLTLKALSCRAIISLRLQGLVHVTPHLAQRLAARGQRPDVNLPSGHQNTASLCPLLVIIT